MTWSTVTNSVVSGGIGVTATAVIVAGLQTLSKRGTERATAADLISTAGGNLADRLDKLNQRLNEENKQLRDAVMALADCAAEMLDYMDAPPEKVSKMKTCIRAARRII